MSRDVPRRGILQGIGAFGIGIGGVSGSPAQLADALDNALSGATPSDHDLHTLATWRAVVDAVVPETPELASELGDEHRPGGLAVDLEVGLIEFVNGFLSPEGTVPRVAPSGETAPLSESIAAVLDVAAIELLARGGNHDPTERRFEGGGPFASLSRHDRFLAMHDVEENGGKYGGFVVAIVAAFPAILYYSEWSGYDDFTALPSKRTFSDNVQSWTQTDYEGHVDGAAVLRGYEVDKFEETYGSEADTGQSRGESGDGTGERGGRGSSESGRGGRRSDDGDSGGNAETGEGRPDEDGATPGDTGDADDQVGDTVSIGQGTGTGSEASDDKNGNGDDDSIVDVSEADDSVLSALLDDDSKTGGGRS